MTCPNCHSTRIEGPKYVHRASLRVSAVMYCGECREHFDAYHAWGTGNLTVFMAQALKVAA